MSQTGKEIAPPNLAVVERILKTAYLSPEVKAEDAQRALTQAYERSTKDLALRRNTTLAPLYSPGDIEQALAFVRATNPNLREKDDTLTWFLQSELEKAKKMLVGGHPLVTVERKPLAFQLRDFAASYGFLAFDVLTRMESYGRYPTERDKSTTEDALLRGINLWVNVSPLSESRRDILGRKYRLETPGVQQIGEFSFFNLEKWVFTKRWAIHVYGDNDIDLLTKFASSVALEFDHPVDVRKISDQAAASVFFKLSSTRKKI